MAQPTGSEEYGLPTQQEKKKFNPYVVGGFVVVTLLLSSWLTTQYLASQFNYPAALGGINHLYLPWSWVDWYSQYGNQYPHQFKKALSAGVVFAGVFLGIFTLVRTLATRNSKKHQHLHGSARWATPKEITDMGLFADDGVYVGAYKDKKNGKIRYLRHNGPEHILAFAPTRSGKGVGLVLPTLLSWKESALILDIKGENWALTSGWRSKYANNNCIRFDPSNPNFSHRFNPLEEIRIGTENEVGDSQNLALMLVDPRGEGLKDHWSKTAFALLTGVILYSAYRAEETGEHTNLPKLANRLSDPNKPSDELWEEMCEYKHPVVAASGRDMIDRPEEERGSVLSTAKSFLSLYVDPVVAKNVERSDFKIRDFMNSDQPMSIYLVINPADKGRLMPLVRIVLAQTIRTLVEKMEFKDGRSVRHYKHRLLLMLDEFASLGKIEILEEALHYMAGYGMKGYLIAQDVEQIRSRDRGYGNEETVTSGCHIKNAFAPNKPETAKYLSDMCGDTTVTKTAITTSGKRTGVFLGNVSRTFQEIKRPLLTPDECRRLPGAVKNAKGEIDEAGDMLISVAGFPVVYGKQILYFKDDTFMKRAQVPAIEAKPVHSTRPIEVEITDSSSQADEAPQKPSEKPIDISDYMEEEVQEPQATTDDKENDKVELDF